MHHLFHNSKGQFNIPEGYTNSNVGSETAEQVQVKYFLHWIGQVSVTHKSRC